TGGHRPAVGRKALHDKHQVTVGEAGRDAVAYVVGPDLDHGPRLRPRPVQPPRDVQALPQHGAPAARQEAVVGQRVRVARDAAGAGGDVHERAGRRHVAVLTLLPLAAGRAVEPLAVSAVNVDAEDRALVAGRTVTALAVERCVDVLAAVDVVERAEEELPCGGAEQGQAEPPVRQADLPGDAGDLVTVVAVDAPGGGPPGAAQ